MSLDRLAERAARDLRDTVETDPERGLSDLVRTRSRRTAFRGALSGAVAVVLALAVVVAVNREPDPQPVDEGVRGGVLVGMVGGHVAPLTGEMALPTDDDVNSQLQFIRGGRELVYATRSGRVVAWDVRTGATRLLTRCSAGGCPFSVSPDGATVALVGRTGFVWVDVATGTRRPYPYEPEGAMSWSPDGTRLAVMADDGLHVVDLASGESRLVDPAAESGFWRTAQWSPDGTRLAYVQDRGLGRDVGGRSAAYAFSLVVLDADGSNRKVVARLGRCVCFNVGEPADVTWSPDGTRLAASHPDRGTFSYDLDGGDEQRIGPGARFLAWQPVLD